MLEARPARPDPSHPGQTLPAHGAAMIESLEDWGAQKTALEVACRELKSSCQYAIQGILDRMNRIEKVIRAIRIERGLL